MAMYWRQPALASLQREKATEPTCATLDHEGLVPEATNKLDSGFAPENPGDVAVQDTTAL